MAEVGRLQALVGRMTLEEKIGQLTMLTADFVITGPTLSANYTAEVRAGRCGSLLNLWGADTAHAMQRVALEESRLGIPLLLGFDVVHGHRTVFPVPLGEAATFDPVLWEATAAAAAREAAADGINMVFAPDLDVSRDPRWGRIVEGPGEDAYVASRFGEAKLRGFQGNDLADPARVVGTVKHFGAYGAVLAGRDYASAEVSERLLHEVYFPPFRAAIDAGAAAIMPSFNDLAGVPVTANTPLLRTLARERWGFDGLMVSDYNAITELLAHGVAADHAEAAALALNAGIDVDMMGDAYRQGLPVALERGLTTIERVDESVLRVLQLKARLGLFDQPMARGDAAVLDRERAANRPLARTAAARSMVLLTNRDSVLPLKPDARIGLIGPHADHAQDMLGPWFGAGRAEEAVTWAAGLKAALPNLTFYDGDSALLAAAESDVILLAIGESAAMSGEASARGEPVLPREQQPLVDMILAGGKPVVAIVATGRPLIITDLIERAHAVLIAWHLGSESGNALADVVTGKTPPVGRLPISWPVSLGQVPIYFGRRPTGRPADPKLHYTSKYLDLPTEPLFPFGHGLGYTRFEWRAARVSPERAGPGGCFAVEADIANVGERDGEETAFLFTRDPVASTARPLLELRGFGRIALPAGGVGTVRFTLSVDDLGVPGAPPDFAAVHEPGRVEVYVGPSADHTKLIQANITLT